jgi:hypothetical protein
VAALSPLPAFAAGDPASTAVRPSGLKAAVQTAAVRHAAVVAAPAAKGKAVRKDEQSSSKQSTGFFRSGPGAAALAILIVGGGYALYSASHDRIHSPAK